ncbi:polysaccharide biosynthesis protein [Streptomyces roseirectus]|uniref:Polysaccharide biosynthesis protein n=1 Tax=Streptomyces roseirectus TaxID=2768066 RepID=A0A7H0I5S2_9ACTN|nr:Wzz/FepE/Etk N-terminal domain-containing protein [Streptomyces roseirectus]QNP68138.1 polysaccharide biosynthesis protein [Streptomyces roseirectus]
MTTDTASDLPPAPLLDLQSLVVAVRRRRRLWSAAALLGLLVGAAIAVLLPPPPSAVTKILVAHQQDQPNDPGTLIRTDVALLHTTRIADTALKTLRSREEPEEFMKAYGGVGLTNNLLQIDVTGVTEAQAVARAKAIADAFVADHVRRIREAADAEAKGLLEQRDRIQAELARVDRQIGGSQESGPDASADLESLYARRAELTSRAADFGRRAAEARVGTPQLVAGTQIVDAPRAVAHSLPRAAVTNAVLGLVLGLVLGVAVAAVASVVADRPVLRREIAAHLGASVTAELPRRAPRLWGRRRTRAARARLIVSLTRTARGPGEALSLLELGCARTTARLALDLAGALGEEGPVTVVDGLPGAHLARLAPKAGGPVVVDSAEAAPLSPGGPLDGAEAGVPERRLGVGSVAPGTAWTDLRRLGARTVLVVRAGHGSAAWLHTVARQLVEQDVAVAGVVLVDPDPRDRTDGTLWDGPPGPPRSRGGRLVRPNGTRRLPRWAARVPDSDQEAR